MTGKYECDYCKQRVNVPFFIGQLPHGWIMLEGKLLCDKCKMEPKLNISPWGYDNGRDNEDGERYYL